MPATMPSGPDVLPMLEQFATGGPSLILLVIWGLLVCFLGYPLLRIQLVMIGLFAGVLLGLVVASAVSAAPTGADLLIFCLAGAILLGLLSWFLYRLVLAISVLAGACLLTVTVMNTTAGWIIGALIGLVLGVLLLVYTRPVVIIVTGVGGSGNAVTAATVLAFGGAAATDLSQLLQGRPLAAAIAGGGFLVLAALGVYCQFRLASKYRMWMSPEKKAPPAEK